MDFLKNAAKLAQEMQGGGAGHGNAAHGGGHGGVGDLMGAAEGMFAQHTTTTTTHRPASNYNDEYSGPETIHTTTTHITSTQTTAPHQRPSTSELMSSGQVSCLWFLTVHVLMYLSQSIRTLGHYHKTSCIAYPYREQSLSFTTEF